MLLVAAAGAQATAVPRAPVAPPPPAASAAAALQLPTVIVRSSATEGFRAAPRGAYAISGRTLREQPATPLPEALAQHLPGAALTHEQGNTLQPSLRVNGFAASPLLGTPQGLSVFQDGVRVNEPFGDTVNWDLLPSNAIRSITLVPYADPVFGLNTLGGSVLIETRDGRHDPGGEIGMEVGSFGRTAEHVRVGGRHGHWSAFVAARDQHDNGIAPDTPSRNRTLFAKATRDADGNQLDVSYTFAQSHLSGSQTLPADWLRTPATVYTAPDWIDNQLDFLNIGDTQVLAPHWQVTARVYLRNSDQSGLNSNVNNSYDGTTPTLANPVADNVLDALHQQSRGVTLAVRTDAALAGMRNVLSAGVDFDRQTVAYTQARQAATFTSQRDTLGIGPFDQQRVELGVHNVYRGFYFSEKLSPNPAWDLEGGGRYDDAHVDMIDHLGGALGGAHGFARFNPSVGVDLHPTHRASYDLRYAQGMRVPMPVELTCASPSAPCTLPNVLVADPSLAAEVAHTVQAGAVWHLAGMRLRASYTRTALDNAIQFISLPGMTQGYFTNIPQERLRTMTVDLLGGRAHWQWSASLSHTLATYESAFLEQSASNSSADASGNIQVRPGDRLPNIPVWTAALSAQYMPTERWTLRGQLVAYSDRYAQGNENNQDARGRVGGFAVVNFGTRYRVNSRWRIDLSIHNLFNRVYEDFGQLGQNAFTGPDRSFSRDPTTWRNTEFVAAGAPRAAWLGLSCSWP